MAAHKVRIFLGSPSDVTVERETAYWVIQDIEEILGIIDSLPEVERELLDQKLAERLEADWRREAEEARRQAQARGIDQAAAARRPLDEIAIEI